ncbi:MAG: DUF6265 family protein [Bacteroidia bacterium]
MLKINTLLYLAIALFLTGCTNNSTTNGNENYLAKIKVANWFIGNWQDTSTQAHLHENWKIENDSTYTATSYVLVNNDTVFNENITLQLRNNTLSYVVRVNGEPAVSFDFTTDTNNVIVFENKAHDFPQRITYTHPTNDSLCASIEGVDKGKYRKELFLMRKN